MKADVAQRDHRAASINPKERRIAMARLVLGEAQIFAAVLAAISLEKTGTSSLTLTLTGAATALTLTSLLLFKLLPRWKTR